MRAEYRLYQSRFTRLLRNFDFFASVRQEENSEYGDVAKCLENTHFLRLYLLLKQYSVILVM